MEIEEVTFVRIVFLLTALCVSVPICASANTNAQGLAELENELLQVTAMSGTNYIRARTLLDKQHAARPADFESVRRTSVDWRVQLLCGIVAERSSKNKELAEFLTWKPQFGYDRETKKREKLQAAAIADKARNLPFCISEHFWKGNEMADWEAKSVQDVRWRYLARVLGQLKFKEARALLEQALESGSFVAEDYPELDSAAKNKTRVTIAEALGEIGDPRSVTILIKCMNETNLYVRGAVGEAVAKCADKSSVPLLKAKLNEPLDEAQREFLEGVVRQAGER